MNFNLGNIVLSTCHIDLKENCKFKPQLITPFVVVLKVGSQAY